jgi:hypothetical protein
MPHAAQTNDWQSALAKLSLKPDDILLVDVRRVDLARLPLIAVELKAFIIPVLCAPGETPEEAFAAMSQEHAVALLQQIANGSHPTT